MVFLSAVQRDRVPGDFYRCAWRARLPAEGEIQARIGEAVTGVISIEKSSACGGPWQSLFPNGMMTRSKSLSRAPKS
ncbi:MAG: hypothetical protein ACR2NN_14050 [Bryobacteraceae bacterium]